MLLRQPLAHHQPHAGPRAPPRLVGLLVDDVADVVEAAGVRRPARGEPRLARLTALPGPRRETQNLGLDPTAFERARANIRRDRRDPDRPPAPRARIFHQPRHPRIAAFGIALDLVA